MHGLQAYAVVAAFRICAQHGEEAAKREVGGHVLTGFYRTRYPASYTHRSLGRTRQFTLPASTGTQMCLLCLSLKSQIPKLFRNDSGFPIFTGYL